VDVDEGRLCLAEHERATRARASAALHNIVMAAAAAASQDDVTTRHEARVLRLLEQLRAFGDHVRFADTDLPLFVHGTSTDDCSMLRDDGKWRTK